MALNLDKDPVQLDLRPNRQLFDLIITATVPASLPMSLAPRGLGHEYRSAGAFSNEAGVIVDSFRFSDVFRTIELNPSEKDRFFANIDDVVAQKVSVQQLLDAPAT